MGSKIRRKHPADLLVIMELNIPGEMGDPVGQELDLPVGVTMRTAADKAAHDDVDAQLLLQFPPEAHLGGFAFLELPAGELPLVSQAVSPLPAGNENPAVFFKDGCGDRDPSEVRVGDRHPVQTLTTRQDLVKAKTLESGVDLWNKKPSFWIKPYKKCRSGTMKKWIWGFLYLFSILLGNAFVIWFGIVTIAGLTFPAGVVWIGLTFSFRDFVQRYWGDWATWSWMIAASVITLFFNLDIALASMTAFFVSESLDWFFFKILKRSFVSKVVWSNLVSCPVDSLVFVLMAFGPIWPAIFGQAIIKYLSGLLVLPFLIVRQKPSTATT
jgi:uncharacterized PurR-regulated membrane protein YhhQ (DUF165 family)